MPPPYQKCPDCGLVMEVKVTIAHEGSDGYMVYEPFIVQCRQCKRIEQVE